jgi:hypothetical protein
MRTATVANSWWTARCFRGIAAPPACCGRKHGGQAPLHLPGAWAGGLIVAYFKQEMAGLNTKKTLWQHSRQLGVSNVYPMFEATGKFEPASIFCSCPLSANCWNCFRRLAFSGSRALGVNDISFSGTIFLDIFAMACWLILKQLNTGILTL